MQIILSAGNYGGTETDWSPIGILEDGREYMQIEDSIYVKVSDVQAVFYGLK